ncbi:arginase family protein [Purpureocillium lavendulum]|uniref:Arginase family protein n=1 Tax=Purpureocillium lavendulum TaxID=1247861 RepID=A0AB34FVV8_9HYPO|nr:arginase family protein [Purpureocillium lavendulum]
MPPSMNLPEQSRYSVSDRAVRTLRAFMNSLIEGSFEHSPGLASYSSDWIEAMWQATSDLSSWISKISLIMTNEVREHGTIRDPNDINYEGSAFKLANYVHVQWYWMIYPGVFLLISLSYLLSTIVAGARDGVVAWKGDSLPMLFSHIDPRILALGPEKMDVPKGLDDLGKIQVALTRNNQGYWTFEPHSTHDKQDNDLDDNLAALLGLV